MHADVRVLRVTLLSLPYLVPRLCAFLCPRTNFAFGWAGEFLGISKKKHIGQFMVTYMKIT